MKEFPVKLSVVDADFVTSTAKVLKVSPEEFLSKIISLWVTQVTKFMTINPDKGIMKAMEYAR